ncbi:AAA family ATPase [Amnibacterium endophyticum]|uniref:AAA family ATPase n=1 Tax=Amnibacterium endophyticum TaxID=2109337 RepID=A0ABW4LHZ1_9MICO
MPRLIPVAGQKGGVGKTTTAMSLAAVTARSSRVLLVDVDPQQSATWWAERADEDLPFDFTNETDPGNLTRLRELPYDVIFIDTPGSLEGRDVLAAVLDAADFAILPTEPSPLSIAPLMRTISDVVRPRGVEYRVLLNKVDPRVPQDATDAEALLDGSGVDRFQTVVRNYKIHAMSPLEGKVVTQYSDSRIAAKAVDDYQRVALEMFAIWAHRSPVTVGAR